MNNIEESRKEYLETLSHNGEIEFDYNGKHYHLEPSTDSDGYAVWQFSAHGADDGKLFAKCKTHEDVLNSKIYDGKSLLEIDDDITNCYLM